MALTYTPPVHTNNPCPDFKLLGVDTKNYSLKDFSNAKALCVMFICNHCPYVKAIEDRLISLANELIPQGCQFVAICANDAENYPDDSYPELQKRAHEKNYPFVYLYDETQEVAKKFGAVCTPDFFVYDSKLQEQYRGRLDDSWKDASQVKNQELKAAILNILNGQVPNADQKASMGCNIKWKK